MIRKPDLAKARADVAAFAKLAGRSLAKFQGEALRLEARTTYVLGPRQSGKSRGAGRARDGHGCAASCRARRGSPTPRA